MTTQTPPGWYPDPYGTPDLLRWWDGRQWTDATQPTQPGIPPGTPQQGTPQQGVPQPGTPQQGTPQQGSPQQAATQPGVPQQWGQPQQAQSWPPQEQQWPGYQQPTSQYPVGGPAYPGAPPPQGSKSILPWVLGGAGVAALLVVVILVVVALVNRKPAPPDITLPTPPPARTFTPEPPGQPTQALPIPPQPVGGQITDPATGLSYAFIGEPWRVPRPTELNNPDNPDSAFRWTAGESAVGHAAFDGKPGHDWLGTVYSGPLHIRYGYTGPESLRTTAASLMTAFNNSYYSPPHKHTILENKEIQVSGKRAWIIRFEMDFPQAKSSGWKWQKELGAIVLVDRGASQRPGVLYVSVPDNLDVKNVDKILQSLRAA